MILLDVRRQERWVFWGGTGWREFLEGGTGRTIDWNLVEPGSRQPLALHSFLEELPDSLHPSIYNRQGGEYVVPLLLDGPEVGAIGVAAHTRVVVDAAGRFHGIMLADGRTLETATLYVSQYPSFTDFRIPSQVVPTALLMFVPADEQPEHERVADLSWPIRIDSPISLMEVEPVLPQVVELARRRLSPV